LTTPRTPLPQPEADYVLAVKDNQPRLGESITTFFDIDQAEGWKNTPHAYTESVEKDHGRLEARRCGRSTNWTVWQIPVNGLI
jgi:predicted transposase YbfD/YdcC